MRSPLLRRLPGVLAALAVAALLQAAPARAEVQAQGQTQVQAPGQAQVVPQAPAQVQNAPADTVDIKVLPQAEVFGETYTLGEIAEFDSTDLKAVEALARVNVGRAPMPGGMQRLSKAYLQAQLNRQHDVAQERIRLTVPPTATVVRSAQRVSRQELERVVLHFAKSSIPADAGDYRQELETPVSEILLPKGDVTWDVEPLGTYLGPGGDRNFRVDAKINGKSVWRNIVRVRQAVFQDVVVTTHPMGRNQPIAEADVTLVRRDMSQLGGGSYLTSIAAAVGKRTVRPLNRDELLDASLVVAPLDVRAGGRVMLEYIAPGIALHAPGVAMVGAKIGEFIPVRNLDTGKIVHGVLRNEETVEVN